jgi:hypothetical protein
VRVGCVFEIFVVFGVFSCSFQCKSNNVNTGYDEVCGLMDWEGAFCSSTKMQSLVSAQGGRVYG